MQPNEVIAELRIGLSLCTRLPVALALPPGDDDVARASWSFPLAGLAVGLIGAATYWLAARLGLPLEAAALLALAATLLATGAIHEDGLADTADGFGGGKTREHKLEIMRDSRIGAFGACALVLSLLLRWSALAAIAAPHSVAAALIAAHMAARAPLPLFMNCVAPARPEGLSAEAGKPPPARAAIAIALGFLGLVFTLGWKAAIIGALVLTLAGLWLAWLSRRQIGGQTGDVLGTFEQLGEAAILLIAAASF